MRRPLAITAALSLVAGTALLGAPVAAVEPFGSKVAVLKDIVPGADGSSPSSFVRFGNKVLFAAFDNDHGDELWITDGTAAGTRILKDIRPGTDGSMPQWLTVYQGQVYFSAGDSVHGRELWRTDGTAAGTTLVKDLNDDPGETNPQNLTVVNGVLWFSAGTGIGPSYMGREPWVSDGTAAGTVLLADVNPGTGGSQPRSFTDLGDNVAFVATTDTEGTELWVSNGTGAGTSLVKDINPGTASSTGSWALTPMTTFDGDLVVFPASDGSTGTEMWRSDGTAGGTSLLEDIQPGATGSSPMHMTAYQGLTYFVASDPAGGYELWRTNGSKLINRVADLNPGSGAGAWRILGQANGDLIVLGADADAVGGVFAFDGTTFTLLKDIDPDGSFMGSGSVTVDDHVFFVLDVDGYGNELWTSDGTPAGTRLFADLVAGPDGGWPTDLAAIRNTLLFDGTTPAVGSEPFSYTVRGSSTTAKPAASYTRRQARLLRIKVPVVVKGASGLTGTVVLREGTKKLGSAKVVKGKAVVRITKKLAAGKHKVKATYSGSWKARRSVSKAAIVKVG